MSKLKTTIYVSLLIGVGLIIEWFRAETGIPVTILDILLLPLCVIFIYIVIREILFADKSSVNSENLQSLSPAKRLGLIVVCLLMLLLGAWGIWAGLSAPFDYFSGVKGAAHGYTLAIIGLLIVLFGLVGVWSTIKTRSEDKL